MHMLALIDYKSTSQDVSLASASPSSVSKNNTPGGTMSSASVTLNLEELINGVIDLHQLGEWVACSLVPLVHSTLSLTSPSPSHLPEVNIDHPSLSPTSSSTTSSNLMTTFKAKQDRQGDIINSCFDKQVNSLLRLSPIIWQKMADMIVIDCKNGLKVSNDVFVFDTVY
jgi:hypothetical protein